MINHFIGIGGGGSNILLSLQSKYPSGMFTVVSDPIRSNIPEAIHFVHFIQPNVKPTIKTRANDVEDSEMYNNITLPSELLKRIEKDQHIILISSLGGYTGTILLDVLIDFLSSKNISFMVFCGWPFEFEGPGRLHAAVKFRLKHLVSNKVIHFKSIFDTEQQVKHTTMGEFLKALNSQIAGTIIKRIST